MSEAYVIEDGAKLKFVLESLCDLVVAARAGNSLLDLLNEAEGAVEIDFFDAKTITDEFISILLGRILAEQPDWITRITFYGVSQNDRERMLRVIQQFAMPELAAMH